MGLYHSPKTITNGLAGYWDAGNTKSYPGSGTSWSDISGYKNTGTFYGTPTFSSSKGGYLTFNGSQGINITYNSSSFAISTGDFTVESWFYQTSSTLYQRLCGLDVFGATGNLQVELPSSSTGVLLHINGGYTFYGSTPSINVWNHLVFSRISGTVTCYLNGAQNGNSASQAGSVSSTASFVIGANGTTGGNGFIGNIAMLKLHKGYGFKAADVRQTFNTLRGRFGI